MTEIEPRTLETLTRNEKLITSSIHCLYEIFHCNTEICRYEIPSRKRDIARMEKSPFLELIRLDQKAYLTAKKVSFPKVPLETELDQNIIKSQITKRFSTRTITLDQLGKLLYLSYGVTKELPDGKKLRAVLSMDNLYPIEVYPIIFNVDSLEEGIYHYNAKRHLLETLKCEHVKNKLANSLLDKEIFENANALLMLTAIFKKVTLKYGDRGYRYVLLDAGHIIQNIYLLTSAMDIGFAVVREFIDDEINDLIGINGVNEAVICGVAIGGREEEESDT
jgi:SagB-type dehydrogenase family enzyme